MFLECQEDKLSLQQIESIKEFYSVELLAPVKYNKTRVVTSRVPQCMLDVIEGSGFKFIEAIVLNFFTPAWMHIDAINRNYVASDPLAVCVFPLGLTTNEYNASLGNRLPKMLITNQRHPTLRGAFLANGVEQYIVDRVSEDNPLNKMLTDYSSLENLSSEPFPRDVWFDRYSFMPYEFFNGLSYRCEWDWKPGNVMIIDKSVVHTPSSFNNIGISKKSLVITNIVYNG